MQNAANFFSAYSAPVASLAMLLRTVVMEHLPGVQEQIDGPANMIAYSYGQRYMDMVCTIIPSKKGLKLGFYKGVDLPDPDGLLEGTGKISRYVVISDGQIVRSAALAELLIAALATYRLRTQQ